VLFLSGNWVFHDEDVNGNRVLGDAILEVTYMISIALNFSNY
jgi:hypothetical protein